MKRNATAIWRGTISEGSGNLTTQSEILRNTKYSYKSRFENEPGTNPEELIAAAHAGCFTMALTFALTNAGFTADELQTRCDVTIENNTIKKSELNVTAKVPGITLEKFKEIATAAKVNCPVSKLLNCEITMSASLA
jgi:osmotically inducible protein OsmC